MSDGDDPKHNAAHTERDGDAEHHYDSNWNLIGHTEHDGDREHHYDSHWNATGHTERDGDREHHYDTSWNSAGHSERDGDLEHHYDTSWNSTGHTERDGNLEHHYDTHWNRVGTSSPVRGGSGGSSTGNWVGGGGSNVSGVAALITLFIIIGIPAGLIIQWHKKRVYIAELPTVHMTVGVGGPDADESGSVRYTHGHPQTLRFFVNWDNQAVYWSEKPIRVVISRNGRTQYDQVWPHDKILQFNSLVFDLTDTFPIGKYAVRASVEGSPPAEQAFVVHPLPVGNIFVSDSPPGWPRHDITTLQHRPGENKKIFAYIRINETIPAEGRVVYISLSYEGATLFNYSNRVTEQNRDFYIPYEADFSEGLYTARLSADGDPSAEAAFTVQYPVVETEEEKNQRVKQLLDRLLPVGQQPAPAAVSTPTGREDPRAAEDVRSPSPAVQAQDCYNGAWRENESNEFVWNFRRYGDTLRIVRNDRFVKGEFRKAPDGWVGFLSWGNGTIWKGVVLHEANDACDEVTTNQRWWYKR
jgi:hypothetical protein